MSEQATAPATSVEACFDALGHIERRRLLLALLNGTAGGDRPVVLDDPDSDAAADTLQLSMHHVHLPKLENLEFIHVDRQRGSVTEGPRFDEIRPLLELLDDNRERLPDGLV